MSYQEQIFKEMAKGKYGAKPYIEMARHKINMARNNDKKASHAEEKKNPMNKNIIEDLMEMVKNNTNRIPRRKTEVDIHANKINHNIGKNIQPPMVAKKEQPDQTVPEEFESKVIVLDKDSTTINQNIQTPLDENQNNDSAEKMDDTNQINIVEKLNNNNHKEKLVQKISEIEKCLEEIEKELERVKMVQNDIINVVNQISEP